MVIWGWNLMKDAFLTYLHQSMHTWAGNQSDDVKNVIAADKLYMLYASSVYNQIQTSLCMFQIETKKKKNSCHFPLMENLLFSFGEDQWYRWHFVLIVFLFVVRFHSFNFWKRKFGKKNNGRSNTHRREVIVI